MGNINRLRKNKRYIRATFFRKVLTILEHNTPEFIKKIEIQILLNTTAKGFGTRAIRVWDKSYKGALAIYKEYTKYAIKYSVKCDNKDGFNSRKLYYYAFKTGSLVSLITGFTEKDDIERLVFYLYKNIEIDMRGNIPGNIYVSKCYFAKSYKPYECRIMSLVDSGVIAGINGGGRLGFTQRITEGCSNCKACFAGGSRNG